MNAVLRLDPDEARRESPALLEPRPGATLISSMTSKWCRPGTATARVVAPSPCQTLAISAVWRR
jgi:hypothetical protein